MRVFRRCCALALKRKLEVSECPFSYVRIPSMDLTKTPRSISNIYFGGAVGGILMIDKGLAWTIFVEKQRIAGAQN